MVRQVLTQERIIQAAIDCIETGQSPTFSTLARTLGTRSQALYPYFANQQALSYAIFNSAAQQLSDQLKTELFGQSGRDGLLALAVACRREVLAHIHLAQYLLGVPRDTENPDMQQATDVFHELLGRMISPVYKQPRVRLLAGRWLRDLIVGDALNVGSGWFKNRELTSDESFSWLVNASLDRLAIEDQQVQ